MIIFVSSLCLYPAGDVGVICVPRSLRVLLLLPPSCHRLLCTANRDNRPGPAGVQPPRVGTGDGGPGLFSRLRENPSVQLRLAGLRTRLLEYNRERRQTTERKRGKERQRKLNQLSVSISGPNLWLFSLGTTLASESLAAQYYILLLYSLQPPLLSQFCHQIIAHRVTAKVWE